MELQDRIENAAWELFTQRGYSNVTMVDLAAALGISKKTLYGAIESKDALLTRLVRARLHAAETQTADIINAPDQTTLEKLRGLLRYSLSHLRVVQPVLFHDIRRQLPALWAEIETTRNRIIDQRLGVLIREGADQGELRADLDPSLAQTVLFHSLRGVITGTVGTTDPLKFAQLLEMTIDILYDGIKKGER